MALTERVFQRDSSLYIACSFRRALSLKRSEFIIYGLVRKCLKLSFFSLIIFVSDLALNHVDILYVFLILPLL